MQLEVGDVIYKTYREKVISKETIARVTKTLAVTECGRRFNREFRDSNWITLKSNSDYINSYSKETEELKAEYARQVLISKVNRIDFSELSASVLNEIVKLTNK